MVHICSRNFSDQGEIIRVLVGGEYYDVRPVELRDLQDGATPADLDLSPAVDGPRELEEDEWHRLRRLRAL